LKQSRELAVSLSKLNPKFSFFPEAINWDEVNNNLAEAKIRKKHI